MEVVRVIAHVSDRTIILRSIHQVFGISWAGAKSKKDIVCWMKKGMENQSFILKGISLNQV